MRFRLRDALDGWCIQIDFGNHRRWIRLILKLRQSHRSRPSSSFHAGCKTNLPARSIEDRLPQTQETPLLAQFEVLEAGQIVLDVNPWISGVLLHRQDFLNG
jgi:hypothetical protein